MTTAQHDDWVARVLGVTFPGGGAGSALAGWQQARGEAVAQLRKLGRAIRANDDPEAQPAIVLIEAIVKNLTVAPADRRAVAELVRYLKTDDIIGEAESKNGFGIDVSLREPLLRALAPLQAALPA